MNSDPKRIWAKVEPDWHDGETGENIVGGIFDAGSHKDGTEYVRVDLVSQWQPIETAPKDGTHILGYDAKQGTSVVYWVNANKYQGVFGMMVFIRRPFPNPPTGCPYPSRRRMQNEFN